MKSLSYRARWALAGTVAAVGPLLSGCNVKQELLATQQPQIITPSAAASPAGAEALRTGALGRLQQMTAGGNNNQELLWMWIGMFTDEYKSSDTFTQRIQADQRITQVSDQVLAPVYTAVQQTRGAARDAINAFTAYDPGAPSSEVAEMWWQIGFAEMSLGENFCNGIPLSITVNGLYTYTTPLTDSAVLAVAGAHVDSAIALSTGTDALAIAVHTGALITRARIDLDLGNFAAAPALTAGISTAYQWNMTYAITSADNDIWTMTTSVKRYSVGDSTDVTGPVGNVVPFASLHDPRVPSAVSGLGEDNQTPYVGQQIFARDDPIPLVSGLDARLIEAEVDLQAGNIAGMVAILNTLRATPPTMGIFKPAGTLAPLAVPATQAAAINLFFREKGLWTFNRGQRLNDARRQIRQYNVNPPLGLPTGNYLHGGVYGTEVNLPVTANEGSNPLFKGCLDNKA